MLQPAACPRVQSVVAPGVHVAGPLVDEVGEVLVLGGERARHREVGELGLEQVQVEGQGGTELSRSLHGSRVPGEAGRHLLGRPEVSEVRRWAEPVVRVEGASSADGRQHLGQIRVVTMGVVDVVRGDRGDTEPHADIGDEIVAHVVGRHPVVGQLESQAVTEELPQP